MTMQQLLPHALLRRVAEADAFAAWLRAHGEDLVDASALLGGPVWADRARSLASAALATEDLVDHLPRLRRLRALLTLELVDTIDSDEALHFAALDPDHPRADNARLCAEAVVRGVASLEAVSRLRVVSTEAAA